MASTTTTALTPIQGSCLPFIVNWISFFWSSMVSWVKEMEGVGLKYVLNTIWSELEIPPSIPPALFVSKTVFPSLTLILSLLSEPFFVEEEKPEPISKPFTAPRENMAWARTASSLSKAGSPSPEGTPSILHSTTLPTLSPVLLASSIVSVILSSHGPWGA